MGSAESQLIGYKPHIDGLRALAVLSVILFHFSKATLPGGYLGVDCFFVISGYLITAIIWPEMQNGEYSLARFYEHRIRRIIPGLLLVLILSAVIGSLLLLPADLIGFGKSLVATLGFAANIFFWRDGDYFGRLAEEKPLLHMWSLGVEEQFYIFFPLLLAVVAKWWRAQALHVVAALAAMSYLANVLALQFDGANPAFFLLPTRAWELGVGAIVALTPERWLSHADRPMRLLGFLGLILLVAAMFFPIRLLPVIPEATSAALGTVLTIFTARTRMTPVAKLFASPPLVFVGLVSYSLYLWHWPTIVLARYYLVRDLSPFEVGAAATFIFIGATLSWRFVEQPFRSRTLSVARVLSLTGGAAMAVALSGVAFVATDGFPARLNGAATKINAAVGTNWRCPVSEMLSFGASRACVLNLPSRDPRDAEVALIGNSHAQMYAPLVTQILRERGETGLLVPLNGCLPTVNINKTAQCAKAARNNLEALEKLPKLRKVIIGTTWIHDSSELMTAAGKPVNNSHGEAMIAAVDDLVDGLLRRGQGVIIIGPIARPGWDVASVTSREIAFGWNSTRRLYLDRWEFDDQIGAAIAHFSGRRDVAFITPHRIQCNSERCDYLIDGHSLYADSNHIAASELQRFRPAFERLRSAGSL
ncbi:acyltransferase family protein [Methylosinus sporium]|uniref:acyltransferase family protein n=1 Tax=Methylosinus sporium TaxID=428 RepID=UPI00383A14BD